MSTGIEDTIWVNVGSAAALVGATIGATFVGAMAISKGIEAELLDEDARAQMNGAEAVNSTTPVQRTRLRAEDVLARQEQQEKQEQASKEQATK
ncbi:hypothetical protein CHLRE_16g689983v5 [Chlamydomonas reinhardtii]|uniref:Cytochrome c synthesis 4 protein n=1 Tax=Chlamydomonas reinhardtii TaxID=3055 RepID=E0AEV6_CHLRE|nr:uncharacterized protein CHLRE_16g689983v5 [Chlamydomonas reinhardtii]ADL27744.1 cytochrome c synthesis 4 protein [Chlamydomonas reinhardtii]PNW72541.1 hypothetical protein CHLRE_16g689983v5 [Chlamydomonas reinhardtii]